MMETNNLLILFIIGYGRSGSTLLDRMLGLIDGFQSCGEIFVLWRRLLDHREPCSCGNFIEKCSFWKSVLEKSFSFSEEDFTDLKNFAQLFYSTVNKKNFFNLYFPGLRTKRFNIKLERLKKTIKDLYTTIAQVSNAKVVIDSSKYPLYALFLSEINTLDLRFIHLIRDSRAVVYSHIRKKFVPQIGYTATKNPFLTAISWNFNNLVAEKLKEKHKYVALQYEEFVTHPKESLLRILDSLDILKDANIEREKISSIFKEGNKIFLKKNHIIAGNAMRFKEGEIEIRVDEEWKVRPPLIYKLSTTFLTFPILRRYHYRLCPKR